MNKIWKYRGDIIFVFILCILAYYVIPFKLEVRNPILQVSSKGAFLEIERIHSNPVGERDYITISDKDTFYPEHFLIGENALSITSVEKKFRNRRCFRIFLEKDILERLDVLFDLEKPV